MERGDGAAGVIASWLPRAEVTLAYPGLQLTPEVYATHGHYLDLHLTVPRVESIAASAMGRITGRGERLRQRRRLRGRLRPALRLLRRPVRGRVARRAGARRRHVARGLEPGHGRRPRAPRAARPGDHPRRGGRAQPPADRPAQPGAERRGAAPRRAAGDGPRGRRARSVRRARDLRAHTPPGAAAGRRSGRVDRRCRAPASTTAAAGTSSPPSCAIATSAAPTGPAPWCTWSRARRRASRTRCAATPPRRRARARAPQRPACRRPRRTRACACGRAR